MDRSKITIILVSYFSFFHLKRIVKELNNHKIIIVENSRDIEVKKKFLNNKNVNVIFPKKNLGYGAGNNLALKNIKTRYGIILNPDTKFTKKNMERSLEYIKEIKNFGILLPRLEGKWSSKLFYKNKKNYISANYKFIGKSYASGCAMIIDKQKIKHKDLFDEKIFLYKEETDLIKRCNEKKTPCYLLKNVTVKHYGTISLKTKKISKLESEIFRNWHWTWSNFYFYKKHFGFFYSLAKFSRSIVSCSVKSILFLCFDKRKHQIYYARLRGYLCSIFNQSSSFRMKTNQNNSLYS